MKILAKLPKIYQNTIKKEIHNNTKVYYGKNNTDGESKNIDIYQDSKSVANIIDDIFALPTYSFNINLLIHTKEKIYDTSLIAKSKGAVITFDNDIIPIADIIKIEKKS